MKRLTLRAASRTEKQGESRASRRTSISASSARVQPSSPDALAHSAVRHWEAKTWRRQNTRALRKTAVVGVAASASPQHDDDGEASGDYLESRRCRGNNTFQKQKHVDPREQLWAGLEREGVTVLCSLAPPA